MICDYYCLDECFEKLNVFTYLDELQEEGKIKYRIVEHDIIRIKDLSLSNKDIKYFLDFFEQNNILEYNGYESYIYEDDMVDSDEELDNEQ
jgi:hypothetical protein